MPLPGYQLYDGVSADRHGRPRPNTRHKTDTQMRVDLENARTWRRQQIERIAYFRWLDAGRPTGLHERFWLEAEWEWELCRGTEARWQ
jgi:hypothetical protein